MPQRPSATRVAGFRQWQARGRQVRKGEKGIRIFGYAITKIKADDDGDDDAAHVWYPVLSVFDISQPDPIDGVEPDIDIAPRLHGDDPTGIDAAVADWLTHEGWAVVRDRLHGEDGRTSIGASARAITIDDTLAPAHAAVTILHEAWHALRHADITDYHQHRGLYETEAESVAYVTAGALGLDTARNGIGYIASWTHGDTTVVKLTADRVLATVHRILDAVDGEAQH